MSLSQINPHPSCSMLNHVIHEITQSRLLHLVYSPNKSMSNIRYGAFRWRITSKTHNNPETHLNDSLKQTLYGPNSISDYYRSEYRDEKWSWLDHWKWFNNLTRQIWFKVRSLSLSAILCMVVNKCVRVQRLSVYIWDEEWTIQCTHWNEQHGRTYVGRHYDFEFQRRCRKAVWCVSSFECFELRPV